MFGQVWDCPMNGFSIDMPTKGWRGRSVTDDRDNRGREFDAQDSTEDA